MKIVNKKIIYKGKFSSYLIKKFLSKNNKKRDWEFFSKKDAVVVLAKTDNNKYIFISNYRIPIEKRLLECPAGLIDKLNKPDKQALLELQEETGYTCKNIIKLGRFPMSAGISDNYVTFYYGQNARKINKTSQEESEDIKIIILSEKELIKYFLKNKNGVDHGIFSIIYLSKIYDNNWNS